MIKGRKLMSDEGIQNAVECVEKKIVERLKEKGCGCFASSHEILGIITEEYAELVEAQRNHKDKMSIMHELEDIAVACVLGIHCIEDNLVDW